MISFKNYELEKNEYGEYTLVINLDYSNEFANLNNSYDDEDEEGFVQSVKEFVKNQFPNLTVTTIKVMLGATLITSFAITPALAANATTTTSYSYYTVQAGDSLWEISNQTGVSIDELKRINHLTSNTIYIGQKLKIPVVEQQESVNIVVNGEPINLTPSAILIGSDTYIPVRPFANQLGATVWFNSESQTVGINGDNLRVAFVLGSSVGRINGEQVNMMPSKQIDGTTYVPVRFLADAFHLNIDWNGNTNTVYLSNNNPTTYSVQSGDSLWTIANKYGTSVSRLKEVNNLNTDTIYVGQSLTIPTNETTTTPVKNPPTTQPVDEGTSTEPYITYDTHIVEQGDNVWNLGIKYGIPMQELLDVNHLTMNSSLSLGQEITIPVHHVPVKEVVSEKYGELLDWWTEAQYVFPTNKVATIVDLETGKSFKIKRTTGANHADVETLTPEDTRIMKEIWGGNFSWEKRPVIVKVDGRSIAASLAGFPHAGNDNAAGGVQTTWRSGDYGPGLNLDYVKNNDMDGVIDLHFLNSTRHMDGQQDSKHQNNVKIAAGVVAP